MDKKQKPWVLIVKGVALVLSFFLFAFILVMPRFTTTYNAAIIDKYDRLAKLDGPKLVLAGSSNMALGYSSALLEEALGMPVVNFGLHGGLGPAFATDMIERHIGPGDIVVLAPTSFDDAGPAIPDCVLAWLTVENHTRLWGGVHPRNYIGMAGAYPAYLRRALDMWKINAGYGDYGDVMYNRRVFNEYGDNVYPREATLLPADYTEACFDGAALSPGMRDYWNEYAAKLAERGATLLMSSPPILQEQAPDSLAALQAQLQADLEFPVISQLENYLYPHTRFYDTGFHLNDVGAQENTQRLIADLLAWQAGTSA